VKTKKLDAEFQKIREDWLNTKDDYPIRLFIMKNCDEEERERRYQALALELGKKLMIFVTEEKDFNITKEEKLEFLKHYQTTASQNH
jgi:hypothetical protein